MFNVSANGNGNATDSDSDFEEAVSSLPQPSVNTDKVLELKSVCK